MSTAAVPTPGLQWPHPSDPPAVPNPKQVELNAAREAVREASIGKTPDEVKAMALRAMQCLPGDPLMIALTEAVGWHPMVVAEGLAKMHPDNPRWQKGRLLAQRYRASLLVTIAKARLVGQVRLCRRSVTRAPRRHAVATHAARSSASASDDGSGGSSDGDPADPPATPRLAHPTAFPCSAQRRRSSHV